jgi:hypothetical protein
MVFLKYLLNIFVCVWPSEWVGSHICDCPGPHHTSLRPW